MDVLPTLLPGFSGTTLPGWLRDRLRDGLGGVCLFARNIAGHAQLAALTAEIREANPDAVVALDEEGGDVTRLFADVGSPFPGNAVLGRLDDLALTRVVAAEVGWAMRRTGCTMTFAPDVDVNSNPDNPVIGIRSLGADADLVARHGVAWVEGLQATGVAGCAKHFPGHGDTGQDSHLALPVVDRSPAELRERELVPFVATVGAGVRAVMTSHILLPQVDPDAPATFSRRVLTGLLREELGFDGVVVTDALDMAGASSPGGLGESAVRALASGCDLLCLGNDNTAEQVDAIVAAVGRAVADGALGGDRVAQAAARVRALAAAETRPVVPEGSTADALAGLLPPGRVAAAFDVSPYAAAWRERAAGRFGVVRLEDRPNIAVGVVPWGPELPGRPVVVAHPQDRLDEGALGADPVLVLGRDVHRHPEARAVVDRLRRDRDVLVVDLGWPSPDRAYADVATFGASRLVGTALRGWLGA
ncbi:beta-N-acetylhexosaminidase [Microlunatus flavus]|uniref:Beta-N-acetylhexosaminidase n=1 Tax=Microlunatus flavus TaxID=1036181 RepID=A0A1H9ARI7_9ACTN|nr:beta-N-acetylhexosaminidase [Microlunatus flavus]SEP79432.1 beta-N-acetylhexosaminidase [Microlunatus flavus]